MDFVKDILHIASFGVYEGNNPNKESTVPSRPEPREMSDSRGDDFEKALQHKKQLERDAEARRIAKHNAKIEKRRELKKTFFPFLFTPYYPPETFGKYYEERLRERCYICGTVPSGDLMGDGSGDPDFRLEIDSIQCPSCQRYICEDCADHSRRSYCPSCVADITRRYG
jgi:hypothetical protein